MPYPYPSLENAEEEDVEEPEEFEEEERGRVIQVPPRIEWKLVGTHFKVELAVWADSLEEAKSTALELFHESLKAVRAR